MSDEATPVSDTCCHHGASGHSHTSGLALNIALIATVLFVIAEATVGKIAHSLALMSDAGHNFSDALSLGLSSYAVWMARKPADAKKTFGYHRVAILTAFINSVSLAAIGVIILIAAVQEILHPTIVNSTLMLVTAAVALVVNSGIVWALHGGAKNSLNIRATYIHMATDVVASIAVLIAAAVIHAIHWMILDPLVSIGISCIIFASCWGIVREATEILLEGAPRGLDMGEMVDAILGVPSVDAVHDLHVWTVADGMNYLSCHIEVPATETVAASAMIVREINRRLQRDFKIAHSTIQIELSGSCESATGGDPLYCGNMTPRAADASGAR